MTPLISSDRLRRLIAEVIARIPGRDWRIIESRLTLVTDLEQWRFDGFFGCAWDCGKDGWVIWLDWAELSERSKNTVYYVFAHELAHVFYAGYPQCSIESEINKKVSGWGFPLDDLEVTR